MPKKPIHSNQCEHDIYLGNDNKSDFYLYLNDEGFISICRRFGLDVDYETIMFDLKKLKEIIK